MKYLFGTLCVLLAACAQTPSPIVAIRGATVVDVTDGSLRSDQTVLIEGKRVVTIGPADVVRGPDHADVIDAAGGYLIPGLWDMHVTQRRALTGISRFFGPTVSRACGTCTARSISLLS